MLISNKAELEAAIDHLKGLDLTKPYRMEIKKQRRSKDQNALYRHWIDEINTFWTVNCGDPPPLSKSYKKNGKIYTKYMPWTPEDVHNHFARMFLKAFRVNYMDDGKQCGEVQRQSTATLSIGGMYDYMIKVRQYMLMVYNRNLETWEGNEFTAYLEESGGL